MRRSHPGRFVSCAISPTLPIQPPNAHHAPSEIWMNLAWRLGEIAHAERASLSSLSASLFAKRTYASPPRATRAHRIPIRTTCIACRQHGIASHRIAPLIIRPLIQPPLRVGPSCLHETPTARLPGAVVLGMKQVTLDSIPSPLDCPLCCSCSILGAVYAKYGSSRSTSFPKPRSCHASPSSFGKAQPVSKRQAVGSKQQATSLMECGVPSLSSTGADWPPGCAVRQGGPENASRGQKSRSLARVIPVRAIKTLLPMVECLCGSVVPSCACYARGRILSHPTNGSQPPQATEHRRCR